MPSTEDNKAVVAKYFEQYWTKVNVDVVSPTSYI